ncbi:MAG: hypothetical protein ACTSSK_01990 [Candidatus Heimdallarchaeota archaeon]
MMVIPKVGFLFDVDGTLTYYRGVDSVVDLLLVNDLEKIRKFNHPIWLVTGRSVKWVQEVFFEHLNKDLTSYMNVMGEYGLISNFQGKRKKRRLPKETTDTLQKVQDLSIELLCEARELECIVSEEKPDKRCLWIEPKEVMLTIRTLPFYGLTTELFLRILEPIIEEYKDKLNFASNPYAIDILHFLILIKKLIIGLPLEIPKQIMRWAKQRSIALHIIMSLEMFLQKLTI